MQIIKTGVQYALNNLNQPTSQPLTFTHRDGDAIVEGTTNEELVSVLLDRYHYLQGERHSANNSLIIELLKLISQKQSERHTRKVLNKQRYAERLNLAHTSGY